MITDLKMPRMGGLELLEKISGDSQTIAVIVVTAQGTIDSAVQAMRMGAYDYITKPIDTNRLRAILQNASALLGARAELEVTRRKLRDTGSLGSLVGPSRKMQEIFRLIEMVAPSTASVLITGASGTGKELVARTIHELSPRRTKPFIRHQLRCDSRNFDRKRSFRARERCFYRSIGATHGVLRTG